MAFADRTDGGRVVLDTGPVVNVTVKAGAATIRPGDLVGYSSGFVKADHDGPIVARYVAVHGAKAGEVLAVTREAMIDFGSGCTATPTDSLYRSATDGGYVAADPGTGQVVGQMATDRIGAVYISQ